MSFASSCEHPKTTAAPHTPGLAEADQVLVARLRQLAQSGDEMAQIVLGKEAKTPEELRHHWLFTRSKNGPSCRYSETEKELLKSHFGTNVNQKLEDLAAHQEWEKLARRLSLGEYEWTLEPAMALLRVPREQVTPWVHSLRESLFFWIGGPTRIAAHKELQGKVAEAVANTFDEQLITLYGSCVQWGLGLEFVSHALKHKRYDLATNLLKRVHQDVNKRSPCHLHVDHAALREGIIAQGPGKGPLFEWFFERTHDALPFRLPFDWAKPYYPAVLVCWDREDEYARAEPFMCQIQNVDCDLNQQQLLDPDPDGHMYLYKGSEELQHKWQKPIRQVDVRWTFILTKPNGRQAESKDPPKIIALEKDSTVLVGRTFVLHGPGLLDVRRLGDSRYRKEMFMPGQRVRIMGRIARFRVLKRKETVVISKRMEDEL